MVLGMAQLDGTQNKRLNTTPLRVPRTTRVHDLRILTSLPAGKMVPLAAIPLLREDAVTRGQATITFEMHETVEILVNAVNVGVKAYLVPFLAFDRFLSIDDLNRSYEGTARPGQPVVPFVETMAAGAPGSNPIFKYMGKHVREAVHHNTAYIEAYNQIWNFRAKNRSKSIPLRQRLDLTLAPAFWLHSQFRHIVPDFDQALIDGEIAINTTANRLPVRGIGINNFGAAAGVPAPTQNVFETGQASFTTYQNSWQVDNVLATAGKTKLFVRRDPSGRDYPDVWAEMAAGGMSVSLSNIDAARKTQAFAELRRQYSGHSDEWIIDLLMDGIQIPDQAMSQPILLADEHTVFGMSKRYASDSADLTASVVNGQTQVDLRFAVPRINTGGVVMIVAEILPEQLFERQADPFLASQNISTWPQYLRDTLDPEKVVVVRNDYVDIDHDQYYGTFGYAPLNHEWAYAAPQVGGRFYRPQVTEAFDEDRQRIWAVETENPVLSTDFYICNSIHLKPFVVTNEDPFEAVVRGAATIVGNTVFGPALIEANNDYSEVTEEIPYDRIQGITEAVAVDAPGGLLPAPVTTSNGK